MDLGRSHAYRRITVRPSIRQKSPLGSERNLIQRECWAGGTILGGCWLSDHDLPIPLSSTSPWNYDRGGPHSVAMDASLTPGGNKVRLSSGFVPD